MVNDWLNYQIKSPKSTFTFVLVSETQNVNDVIRTELQKEILDAYKDISFLKFRFKSKPRNDLVSYLENNILPSMKSQLSKNVWQGDFGEILASLIVSYLRGLTVPLKKIRWKLNKEKSVFATDMVAHNTGEDITDMYYYEIKTRLDLTAKRNSKYVTILAYESLKKNENIPNNAIADFLSQLFYYKKDYDNANKYTNIVDEVNSVNRNFELFFIGEKSTYKEEILDELNSLPPQLASLNVTVVLIDDFKNLVFDLRKTITSEAVNIVHQN